MTNLEHKLTVDDLIVEYMIYKVKNGYEPSFITSEFISFLYYFEEKIPVEDSLYENYKLFDRFFERKNKNDWFSKPHMDMIECEKYDNYLIKANYRLSEYDVSVINTYFMDNGMGKYENFKGQVYKIRKIISEYLKEQPKRQINEKIKINNKELKIGQYVAAEIIMNIWETHINELIEDHEWPKQCNDINKYLLQMDLADIIGLKSIKIELIELYNVLSKRIAIMYHKDKNLRISSYSNIFLAKANYDLLIQGYEKIMNTTFGPYKKSLDIDLQTLTFTESHKIDKTYYWDEDPDIKTNNNKVGNSKIKKLVLNLNKINS